MGCPAPPSRSARPYIPDGGRRADCSWRHSQSARTACRQLADARHRPVEMAANAVLEQRIGKDRAGHAVAVLHLAPAPSCDAPQFGFTAGILVPIQSEPGALGGFLRGERLSAADHCGADLAARHELEQAVDAPLRHVPARVGVDQSFGVSIAEAIGNGFRRILRAPERTLKRQLVSEKDRSTTIVSNARNNAPPACASSAAFRAAAAVKSMALSATRGSGSRCVICPLPTRMGMRLSSMAPRKPRVLGEDAGCSQA